VLFSDSSIAKYIDQNFEPVWESVRPVPMITIDFGNGRKVKRTLHGNIASYVCTADGRVVDVLPGLYKPDTYRDALSKLVTVARNAQSAAERTGSKSKYLATYHQKALLSIRGIKVPPVTNTAVVSHGLSHTPSDVVAWPELTEETTINETQRRKLIHEKLAGMLSETTPAQLKPWLYKDVLHCDLDDPYLGLQAALFENYPFVD